MILLANLMVPNVPVLRVPALLVTTLHRTLFLAVCVALLVVQSPARPHDRDKTAGGHLMAAIGVRRGLSANALS